MTSDNRLIIGIESASVNSAVKGMTKLTDEMTKAVNSSMKLKDNFNFSAMENQLKGMLGTVKIMSSVVKEATSVNKQLEQQRQASARSMIAENQAAQSALKTKREEIRVEQALEAQKNRTIQATEKQAAAASKLRQQSIKEESALQSALSSLSQKRYPLEDIQRTIKMNTELNAQKEAMQRLASASQGLVQNINPIPGIFEKIGFSAQIAFGNLVANAISQATIALQQFVQDSSKAAMTMDGVINTFAAGTGGFDSAGRELQFVRKAADDMGIAITSAYGPYSKFLTSFTRSGGSIASSRQIFSDISAATTSLHLNAEQTQGIYVALEQMANKGTVQMEELKRQLGNTLPGAFELAAESMGVTTMQLTDMMKKGEVMSADFLPKFAAKVREVLGGSLPLATKQAQAEFNRLSTDTFDTQVAFGQLINTIALGLIPVFREGLQGATQFLTSIEGAIPTIQAITAALAPFVVLIGGNMVVNTFKAAAAITAGTLAMGEAAIAAQVLSTAQVFLTTSFVATNAVVTTGNIGLVAYALASDVASLATKGLAAAMTLVTAHPIIAALTAIAAAIGAVIYNNKKATEEVQKASREMEEAQIKTIAFAGSANLLSREYIDLKNNANKNLYEQQRLSEVTDELNKKYPDLVGFLDREAIGHGGITKAVALQIAEKQKLAQINTIIAQQDKAMTVLTQNRWKMSKSSENLEESKILDRTTESLKEVIKQYNNAKAVAKTAGTVIRTAGGASGKVKKEARAKSPKEPKSPWDILGSDLSNQEELIRSRLVLGKSVDDLIPRYVELKNRQDLVNASMQGLIPSATAEADAWQKLEKELKIAEDTYKNMLANSEKYDMSEIRKQESVMQGLKVQVQYNKLLEESSNLMTISSRAAGQLSDTLVDTLFTRLQEGESIWDRFKNAGLSAIKAIASSWVKEELKLGSGGFKTGWVNEAGGSLLEKATSGISGMISGFKREPIVKDKGAATGGAAGIDTASLVGASGAVGELVSKSKDLAKTALGDIAPAMSNMATSVGGVISPALTAAGSITSMATAAPVAAMGTGAMAIGMSVLSPAVAAAAPAMVTMGAALATISVNASTAAIAMSNLAMATAAQSVAMIPFVGGFLAPAAALATGAAIAAGGAMVGAGIAAGSVIAGAGNLIGGGLTGAGNFLSGSTKAVKHARGGVVSSPIAFPMQGGNIGVAGEAGTEVIAPARRMSNGDVGIGAIAPQVIVNNYANAAVEVIKRPNNEMEIKVTELNSMLASSRTNKGMTAAQSRLQSKGKQIG